MDDDTVVCTISVGQGSGPRAGLAVLDNADAAGRPVAAVIDSGNCRLVLFGVDDGALLRHFNGLVRGFTGPVHLSDHRGSGVHERRQADRRGHGGG